MERERLTACFEFLDELRESGRVNMYGAGPYLQERFGLNKTDASGICEHWRRTFNPVQTPRERAAQVTG